jgi:hypothetical protein
MKGPHVDLFAVSAQASCDLGVFLATCFLSAVSAQASSFHTR